MFFRSVVFPKAHPHHNVQYFLLNALETPLSILIPKWEMAFEKLPRGNLARKLKLVSQKDGDP